MTATQRVALVTGATSGIGKAAATALADAGFQVIGTGRNTARATAPAGVTYLDLVVTSDESVASVVKQVIDRFGHIDVLVNNAGVDRFVQNLRRVAGYDVQYFAALEPQKRFAPHLHMAIRGTLPRAEIKQIAAATYQAASPSMTERNAWQFPIAKYGLHPSDVTLRSMSARADVLRQNTHGPTGEDGPCLADAPACSRKLRTSSASGTPSSP
jgi:NAD(P)-dependent dehydrogenase (short-subunit alcohol dehydrogenase family)